MKVSRFSDAEGVQPHAGADGMPVADICCRAGISQATSFNWKKSMTDCCRARCAASGSLKSPFVLVPALD